MIKNNIIKLLILVCLLLGLTSFILHFIKFKNYDTFKPYPNSARNNDNSSEGYAGLFGWPSSTSSYNEQNIALIKNALKNKNLDDKMIGGWVMASYGNTSLWGSDNIINTLLPGGFQSDPTMLPNPKVKGSSNTFLTLGGEGVGQPGDCSNDAFIQTVANWINQHGCTGICFDTEGCYGGSLSDTVSSLNNFISNLEAKLTNKSLKYILCPLGDLDPSEIPHRSVCNKFHLLAPMLYWGNDTYDKIDITLINSWIQNWINKGWKESEIILTYQSTSAATSKDGPSVLNNLAAMLVNADPEPVPPAPAPAPGPGPSSSTQRCGLNWSDANKNCHKSCTTKDDCKDDFPDGNCFASLNKCKQHMY